MLNITEEQFLVAKRWSGYPQEEYEWEACVHVMYAWMMKTNVDEKYLKIINNYKQKEDEIERNYNSTKVL